MGVAYVLEASLKKLAPMLKRRERGESGHH